MRGRCGGGRTSGAVEVLWEWCIDYLYVKVRKVGRGGDPALMQGWGRQIMEAGVALHSLVRVPRGPPERYLAAAVSWFVRVDVVSSVENFTTPS